MTSPQGGFNFEDWLTSLGDEQIKKLKRALGWTDASSFLGPAFVAAMKAEVAKYGTSEQGLVKFNAWVKGIIPNGPAFGIPGQHDPFDPTPPPVVPPPTPDEEPPLEGTDKNSYEDWVAWAKDNGIWSAEVDAIVKQFITDDWTEDKFLRELRSSQTYKTAFPEWDMRDAAGLIPMSEGQILKLRSLYTNVAKNYFGYTPTAQELANLIGKSDKSVGEFESDLKVYKRVQEYGGAVQSLFETIRGESLSDQSLQEFFDPNISTPELDKMFEDAKYRGLPVMLGFQARSQEEAELLRNAGMTPDEAFRKWQEAGSLSPVMNKLGAIDANVTGNEFLNDVPMETLAKGFVFDFTEEGKAAMAEIKQTFAREFARWKKNGGAATDNAGKAVGLLTPGQR